MHRRLPAPQPTSQKNYSVREIQWAKTKAEQDFSQGLTVDARHCSMNFVNRRSNHQMTKMIFHRPAGSRIHGLFSSRPRRLMKLWSIYVSTRIILTFTTSDASASFSWFLDHLPTDSDCHDDSIDLCPKFMMHLSPWQQPTPFNQKIGGIGKTKFFVHIVSRTNR